MRIQIPPKSPADIGDLNVVALWSEGAQVVLGGWIGRAVPVDGAGEYGVLVYFSRAALHAMVKPQ